MPQLPPLTQISPESARWAARLHELARWVAPYTGHWAQDDILPYISGLQILIVGAVLFVTATILLVSHVWAGKAMARENGPETASPVPAPSASFLRLTLGQARAPLLVLITVLGIYCALSIAAFRLEPYGDTVVAVLGWAKTTALVLDLFWFVFRLTNVLEKELTPGSMRSSRKWDFILLSVGMRALRLILPLLAVLVIVPTLDIPERVHGALSDAVSVLIIAFIGVIFCELANTAEKAIQTKYKVDVADNLATRKIQTQVGILKKIFVALVVMVTVACILTVFEPVRSLGKSILASAGVAGIVLGIAAQKSLGTLLAGIQIAFSQPIRLDDVVIVEGEWGRIEEITLTYVVVAIWDLRRMVLPITYFIEKPFQNWTRSNASLLGTVFLYLDYTVPVAELRAELERVLAKSTLWDKKVKGLQVTDARDNVVEVRILASAANSGASFDLRCEIREKMITFIQDQFPGSLPRTRGSLEIGRAEKDAGNSRQVPNAGEAAPAPHVLTVTHGGMASPVIVNQSQRPA